MTEYMTYYTKNYQIMQSSESFAKLKKLFLVIQRIAPNNKTKGLFAKRKP